MLARLGFLIAAIGVSLSACAEPQALLAPAPAQRPVAVIHAAYSANGTASWYGESLDGRRDARGGVFDQDALTAAHRTLPLNSFVRVTNLDNGRTIIVQVTDRGPYARRRVIDVSRAAAKELDFVSAGTAHVNVRALAEAP